MAPIAAWIRGGVIPSVRVAFIVGASWLLAGCERVGNDELEWARASLERNPQIEVVAADAKANVLTIRNKATGELRTVKPSDLAAVPAADLAANPSARSQASAAARGEPLSGPGPGDTPAASASSPDERAARAAPDATSADSRTTAPSDYADKYTISREGGRLNVSGPGVSIVSAGPASVDSTRSGAAAHSTSPVICEGPRFMHLDGRNFDVIGDAVIARNGCELHITNSRIVATDTGIVAQDARVNISNSHVEGGSSSFSALGNTRMVVRGSTFAGLSRRGDRAEVQDLGGNQWR